MMSPALKMTARERQERNLQKRNLLLSFLASGEVYTVLFVIALLLRTSERNALRLLQRMIVERLIVVEPDVMQNSNLKLYGITSHGLAMTPDAHAGAREHHLGRTNPKFINHHVQSQIVRVRAQQAGWMDWTPGKILMTRNERRLKTMPDSLATRPDGRRCAIELENWVKSRKRLCDVVSGHLTQVINGKYDVVYYFCPRKITAALQRALDKIEHVRIDGSKVKLNDIHRSRFKVFAIEDWRGEM